MVIIEETDADSKIEFQIDLAPEERHRWREIVRGKQEDTGGFSTLIHFFSLDNELHQRLSWRKQRWKNW